MFNNLTPLIFAVKTSSIEAVKLLLSNPETNTNFTDAHGFNALAYAFQTGNVELINVLCTETEPGTPTLENYSTNN